MYRHVAVVLNGNDVFLAQLGHLPAYCLDRQAEEIGDVGARQRQVESQRPAVDPRSGSMCVAISHRKLATFSAAVFRAKGDHPLSGFVQFIQRLLQDRCSRPGDSLIRRSRADFGNEQTVKSVAASASMELSVLKGLPIRSRGELQADDLLAPIGQSFGQFGNAGQNVGKCPDFTGIAQKHGTRFKRLAGCMLAQCRSCSGSNAPQMPRCRDSQERQTVEYLNCECPDGCSCDLRHDFYRNASVRQRGMRTQLTPIKVDACELWWVVRKRGPSQWIRKTILQGFPLLYHAIPHTRQRLIFTLKSMRKPMLGWLGEASGDAKISLYLHIPFCDRLCWFCGCHTKQVLRHDPVTAYLEALGAEIQTVSRHLAGEALFRQYISAVVLRP